MPKRQTRKFRGGNLNLGEFNQDTYYSLDYEYLIQAEKVRSELEKPPMNLPLHLAESSYKPNKSVLSKKLIEPKVRTEVSQGGKKTKKFKGGASNLNFQNIDITQFLIRQWIDIPAHAGFTTSTLSIFNPCFTHLFDEERRDDDVVPSIYLCTCRVIYHYENNAENADLIGRGMPPRPLSDDERATVYGMLQGNAGTPPIYIIGNQGHAGSQRNDEDEYIKNPGSALATPWYNPYKNWGGICTDKTMICLLRLTNNSIEGINTFIPAYNGSCSIDARVFKVHRNEREITVFITGSSFTANRGIVRTVGPDTNTIDQSSGDPNFNGDFADENSNPPLPPPDQHKTAPAGWKHGLLRLKYTFNPDSTVVSKLSIDSKIAPGNPARAWRPNQYTEETLADCTSWIGRTEKNYAMYYDPRPMPGHPNGRMALNYHLTWGPSPNEPNYTMVFYTKPYNGTDNNFEVYDDRNWTIHRPPHSDIFARIDAHYGHLGYMHWTCTSPFLLYNGELHAAGHMKIVFQRYLDLKLNEWIATNPAVPYSFDDFENHYAGGGGRPRDHLLHSLIEKVERFATEQTQNPAHGVGSANGKYVRRILNYMKPNPRAGQPGQPAEISNGQRIPFALSHNNGRGGFISVGDPSTWRPVFHYLLHKGFYVLNADGSISAPKNIHTDYLYYMFFYSVDPDDFHLLHFSNPFMIEHPISAYLDFPVGLNRLGDDMLLSYGHGDCYCYLAKFSQDEYNGLLIHHNGTNINDIEYNLYNPTGGQTDYNAPTLAATFFAALQRAARARGIPPGFGFGNIGQPAAPPRLPNAVLAAAGLPLNPGPGFAFAPPAPFAFTPPETPGTTLLPTPVGGPQPGAAFTPVGDQPVATFFGVPMPPRTPFFGNTQPTGAFNFGVPAPAQGFALGNPQPTGAFNFGVPAPAYAAAPAQGFALGGPQAQDDEPIGNQATQTQANLAWLQRELDRRDGGSKRKRNAKRKTRRNRK